MPGQQCAVFRHWIEGNQYITVIELAPHLGDQLVAELIARLDGSDAGIAAARARVARVLDDGVDIGLAADLIVGATQRVLRTTVLRTTVPGAGAPRTGPVDVAALASALRGGALPSCTAIYLDGNPGSGAPVDEALASPERAAALARRQAE